MSKRYYKSKPTALALANDIGVLLTNRPIAVYYRQSTDSQIGNISTSIQTVDMIAYLKERGWSDENIILIDMDAGVSGTTKIDERPGMRLLFDLITQGDIGSVACQDEDRLFRDVTQIQVNIFIQACKTAGVQVITPNMVYDFANEQTGTFHARQFRFKSEMAAEYINTVIKGKLHRAKQRILLEGRWTGFNVVPGYMVDTRKTLPNGMENPNWKRYVPFPQYAEVVNEYFRIFISYAGNVKKTVEHIHHNGPYYPDPKQCFPPDGFKFITRMKQYGHGFCPARNGLVNLLTNATLLGHWAVKGVIVRWNNHEPVVDEELFFKAFNYLSEITLDGRKNSNYKPFSQNARPQLEKNRPVGRPICAGMVFSYLNHELVRVGTIWEKQRQRYVYALAAKHPKETIIWRRTAVYLDEAVEKLLHRKLRATFSSEVWQITIAEATKAYEDMTRQLKTQLATLERVMENQILSLENLTSPEMIRTIESRYKEAQIEHKRLSNELASTSSHSERLIALEKIKDNCEPTINSWGKMTRDEKRLILHNFIDRIEAQIADGTGLELKIVWVDESTDTVVVPKQSEDGQRVWLDSETELLTELVNANASQIEIAQQFPNLTWKRIYYKIADVFGYGKHRYSPRPIRNDETFPQYKKRRNNASTTSYKAHSGDLWEESDIQLLLSMVDNNVSVEDILRHFPHRRWQSMVKKLRSIRGRDCEIPKDKRIRWKDTYADFKQKYGSEETNQHIRSNAGTGSGVVAEQTSQPDSGSVTCSQSMPDQSGVPNICLPS